VIELQYIENVYVSTQNNVTNTTIVLEGPKAEIDESSQILVDSSNPALTVTTTRNYNPDGSVSYTSVSYQPTGTQNYTASYFQGDLVNGTFLFNETFVSYNTSATEVITSDIFTDVNSTVLYQET
jgi:hypothetical protein